MNFFGRAFESGLVCCAKSEWICLPTHTAVGLFLSSFPFRHQCLFLEDHFLNGKNARILHDFFWKERKKSCYLRRKQACRKRNWKNFPLEIGNLSLRPIQSFFEAQFLGFANHLQGRFMPKEIYVGRPRCKANFAPAFQHPKHISSTPKMGDPSVYVRMEYLMCM